jgi:hypothetical protein
MSNFKLVLTAVNFLKRINYLYRKFVYFTSSEFFQNLQQGERCQFLYFTFSMLNFAGLLNLNLNSGIVIVIVESEFCPVCNASIETVRRDMEKRLTEDKLPIFLY